MVLEERIDLMVKLGKYLSQQTPDLEQAIEKELSLNPWFTNNDVQLALKSIQSQFLQEEALKAWLSPFPVFITNNNPNLSLGIVMAGNIPLVGFHDFLAGFLAGFHLKLKLSSKDTPLWEFFIDLLQDWNPETKNYIEIAERLNGCNAYIATGSNNSAKYFEYYFRNTPHIIRSNRTSVAILSGKESEKDLELLSDDVCNYFGMGCRNVTKIYVPKGYDFEPLINALNKYSDHILHNKYKNNYDFQLAIFLLNRVEYMSSDSVLLVPSKSAFSPVSVLHYEYYENEQDLFKEISNQTEELQCIVGQSELIPTFIPFGTTQSPTLTDYADGISTLDFLAELCPQS